MGQQAEQRLFVIHTLPSFATELRRFLEAQGELVLAEQVSGLVIRDRCRCEDNLCATFYTQPKPTGSFGPGHRTVRLMPEQGMLILDVVNEEIVCVEILDRKDVRQKLDEVLP